ncbi:MAG: AMP-binding protein, partial [Parcubacteria group bacterium CG10_big_fil_rev_8_21_14_0_10_41_35]
MTIYAKFRETAEKYPQNQALGYLENNQYQTISYALLLKKVDVLASSFARNGLLKGDKIAFMVTNSP